jgi:hypothetical protein
MIRNIVESGEKSSYLTDNPPTVAFIHIAKECRIIRKDA